MEEKFLFKTKNDHRMNEYTAQKSLSDDENFIIMWKNKDGILCGIMYEESTVERFINNGEWIVNDILNIADIF